MRCLMSLHILICLMSLYLYLYIPVNWPTWEKMYWRPSASWNTKENNSIAKKTTRTSVQLPKEHVVQSHTKVLLGFCCFSGYTLGLFLFTDIQMCKYGLASESNTFTTTVTLKCKGIKIDAPTNPHSTQSKSHHLSLVSTAFLPPETNLFWTVRAFCFVCLRL